MRGMLFSQMEPPPGWEADFHDWYNTEHIPVRLAIPGFDRCTRYEAIDGEPKYLAIYEISDFAALDTAAYRRLKDEPSERTARMLGNVRGFTRYIAEERSDTGGGRGNGDYLSAVAFTVPREDEVEFDHWYADEHVPRLMLARDWLRVRRYVLRTGDPEPYTHIALHELATAEVMDSPERAHARKGPARDALATKPWFNNSGRWLYRVIERFEA